MMHMPSEEKTGTVMSREEKSGTMMSAAVIRARPTGAPRPARHAETTSSWKPPGSGPQKGNTCGSADATLEGLGSGEGTTVPWHQQERRGGTGPGSQLGYRRPCTTWQPVWAQEVPEETALVSGRPGTGGSPTWRYA